MTEARTPATTVRIARAFEGPRHDRLEKIWYAIAEFAQADMRLAIENNTGYSRLSHAGIFKKMYDQEAGQPNPYVLLTEFDFLPDLGGDWLPTHVFQQRETLALLGVQYYTRRAQNKALVLHRGLPGGWWLLIDKARAPETASFAGTPDPCNQIHRDMETLILPGEDCYPLHYGVDYPMGTHLFWSRHYHDGDDNMVVSGVRLGAMRAKHDMAVTLWARSQPAEFLQILTSRYPEVIDG